MKKLALFLATLGAVMLAAPAPVQAQYWDNEGYDYYDSDGFYGDDDNYGGYGRYEGDPSAYDGNLGYDVDSGEYYASDSGTVYGDGYNTDIYNWNTDDGWFNDWYDY